MNKILNIKVLVILLVILDIYLLWQFKAIGEQTKYLKNLNNSYEKRINVFLLNQALTFELQSLKIDQDIILFDEEENEIEIDQIVKRGPFLILKYSDLNCNTCIDEQISLLKYAADLIGVSNILILTNYSSTSELSRFKRLNQLDNVKIFNLKERQLTSIDKSSPYYFILDESYSLKELYVPIRGDSLTTKEYLNKSIKRFF